MDQEEEQYTFEIPVSPTGSVAQNPLPTKLMLHVMAVSFVVKKAEGRQHSVLIKSRRELCRSPCLDVQDDRDVIWIVGDIFFIQESGIVIQVFSSHFLKSESVFKYHLSAEAIFTRFLQSPEKEIIEITHTTTESSVTITLWKDSLGDSLPFFILPQNVIKQMKEAQEGVGPFLGYHYPDDMKELHLEVHSLYKLFGKIIEVLEKHQVCHRNLPEISKTMEAFRPSFQRIGKLLRFGQIAAWLKQTFACMTQTLNMLGRLMKEGIIGQIMGFNGNDFCIQSVSLENQLKLCRSQLQHLIKEDEEMHAQVQKWVDEEFKKWQQAQKYVE